MNASAPASVIVLPLGDETTWSSVLDGQELENRVASCRASALNTKEKGARLERLACWLFAHIPGFTVEECNIYSDDGSQEIDLVLWNSKHAGGFPGYGDRIIIECKNWERPVDSSDVAWFYWKMRMGGVSEGILIAANGITAKASRREAAVSILSHANADLPPKRIHVVTLDEISSVRSTGELTTLLKRKALRLAARSPFE